MEPGGLDWELGMGGLLGLGELGLGLGIRNGGWGLGLGGTRVESAVSEIKVHPSSTTKSETVRRSEGVGGFLKQRQRLLSNVRVAGYFVDITRGGLQPRVAGLPYKG